MFIRRIRIRNYRKLVDPVEIADLAPGLNVIAGDNEAGKSTVLDAVRTVLFERHNVGGKVLADMIPYGSNVQPEIALDFEIDGQACALRKCFGRSPTASLRTPSGSFEGPAADERLAEMLQFDLIDGRASDERRGEARGILGLFWLEQGHGHQGLGLGGRGQQTLRRALEDEVGDVLGGTRGQRLRAAVERDRGKLLTRTGRPTGPLADAQRLAEESGAKVTEVEARLRDYEAEIDMLGRKRAQLAEVASETLIAGLAEGLAKAKARAEALAAIEAEVATRTSDEALGRARMQAAADRVEARTRLAAEAAAAGSAAETLAAQSAEAGEESTRAAAREAAARQALATARATVTAARTQLRAGESARQSKDLTARRAALAKLIEQVAGFEASRTAARAALQAIRVDAKALAKLRDLDAALREARTRRDAAATRVTPQPSHGQTARLDGADLAPGKPVDLTGPAEIELSGWGRLVVTPGAGDLGRLATEADRCAAALAEALDALGCDTLAAAERAVAKATDLASQQREAEQALKALAPKGAAALREDLALLDAEIARLGAADTPGEAPDLDALRAAESAAEVKAEALEADHDRIRAEATRRKEALVRAESRTEEARLVHAARLRQLSEAREAAADDVLATALATATAAHRVAAETLAAAQARRNAEEPELVRLDLERAQDALDQAHAERARLDREVHELDIRLDEKGAAGLGEEAARARAAAGRAAADAERLGAEAEALDLLNRVLAEAETRAREAFLEPILTRVAPFLRLVIPDTQLRLSETLEIAGVERDGRIEPYAQLSVGTREQISVLVRLAFAVYLREKGVPAMVILDDTLVFSDRDRLDRMQLALRRAAQSVQVLVLTCRAQDWRALGAPVGDLHALTQAGG